MHYAVVPLRSSAASEELWGENSIVTFVEPPNGKYYQLTRPIYDLKQFVQRNKKPHQRFASESMIIFM
jgi:hypothetical protein